MGNSPLYDGFHSILVQNFYGTCYNIIPYYYHRVQSFKETVTNQADLTYEEIPGPTSSTGHKTPAGHQLITNIADNPAYEAVKRDQAQKRHN